MIWRQAALAFGIFVFLADFITKYLTQHYIAKMGQQTLWYPYGGIGMFKNFLGIEFSIIHATNRGAAWGLFADWQEWLLYLRIVMIVGLLLYVWLFNKHKNWQIPFALIIAGALGNVVDYFFYDHVIDMFHFVFWGYEYPTFNLADSAILIGIVWLFFAAQTEKTAENAKL